MLVTDIFPFSYNVFNTIEDKFLYLSQIQIVICKCFRIGLVCMHVFVFTKQNKMLELSCMKALADDRINMTGKITFFFQNRKALWEREKILLFHKISLSGILKVATVC